MLTEVEKLTENIRLLIEKNGPARFHLSVQENWNYLSQEERAKILNEILTAPTVEDRELI